ncbi:hypothetical protein F53441_423 [Fusarium austroafricanum]|uniref:NACHT domain-containing protein n=1 Tax=Fusarium austroafricanum TaxID=2364996 RepID=A0A8H4KYD7_9HYPO|nr:hypothetical protein F53441_423 [Fusarium austroafricanum]
MAKSALERILFNNLPQASVFEKLCFCFFIDGLDEYQESRGKGHVYLVRMLSDWTTNSQGRLKVVISSRDYNVFLNSFSEDYRLQFHNLTWFDMKRYARDSLAYLPNSELKDYFLLKIPKKANGIFLWIILVINQIRNKTEDEASQEQIFELLDSLPSEIEALFEYILNSPDATCRRIAYQTISVLRTAQEDYLTFTLLEFSFLEVYHRDTQFSTREDFTESHEGTAPGKYLKRLRGICGGLVESYQHDHRSCYGPWGVLGFTHRSIHEMLNRKNIKQDMEFRLNTFNSIDALSHSLFAGTKFMGAKREARKQCAGVTWMRLAARIDEPPYRFLQLITSWVGELFYPNSDPSHLVLIQRILVFNNWGLHSVARYGTITSRDIFPTLCQGVKVANIEFVRWGFENVSTAMDKPWKRVLIANALLDAHLRVGMPIEELKYFFEGLFVSNDSAFFEAHPKPKFFSEHLPEPTTSDESATDGPRIVSSTYATADDLTV